MFLLSKSTFMKNTLALSISKLLASKTHMMTLVCLNEERENHLLSFAITPAGSRFTIFLLAQCTQGSHPVSNFQKYPSSVTYCKDLVVSLLSVEAQFKNVMQLLRVSLNDSVKSKTGV